MSNKYEISVALDQQSVNKVSQQLSSTLSRSLQKAGGKSALGRLGSSRNLISTGGLLGAGGFLTSNIFGSVKSGSQLADTLNRIQVQAKRLGKDAGQLGSDFAGVEKSVTSLSRRLGVSSTSLADVTLEFAKANAELGDVTGTLEKLAQLSLDPSSKSIEELASAFILLNKAFKVEGADELVDGLQKINLVASNTATNTDEIIEAVTKSAGAFRAVNTKPAQQQILELSSLYSILAESTGESASVLGVFLRTLSTRLSRTKSIEVLKDLGVSATDTSGRLKGTLEILEAIASATEEYRGTAEFTQIAESLVGNRQSARFITLLENIGRVRDQVNKTQNESIDLDDLESQRTKTLNNNFKRLGGTLTALTKTLAKSEAVGKLVDSFASLANALETVVRLLDKVDKSLGGLGGDVIAPLATVAAVSRLTGLGSLTRGAKRIPGGLGKILKRNSGGVVPGVGNSDTVPAMLTPGEFVINKESAKKIGLAELYKLNARKYNDGGPVEQLTKEEVERFRLLEQINKSGGAFQAGVPLGLGGLQSGATLGVTSKLPGTRVNFRSFSRAAGRARSIGTAGLVPAAIGGFAGDLVGRKVAPAFGVSEDTGAQVGEVVGGIGGFGLGAASEAQKADLRIAKSAGRNALNTGRGIAGGVATAGVGLLAGLGTNFALYQKRDSKLSSERNNLLENINKSNEDLVRERLIQNFTEQSALDRQRRTSNDLGSLFGIAGAAVGTVAAPGIGTAVGLGLGTVIGQLTGNLLPGGPQESQTTSAAKADVARQNVQIAKIAERSQGSSFKELISAIKETEVRAGSRASARVQAQVDSRRERITLNDIFGRGGLIAQAVSGVVGFTGVGTVRADQVGLIQSEGDKIQQLIQDINRERDTAADPLKKRARDLGAGQFTSLLEGVIDRRALANLNIVFKELEKSGLFSADELKNFRSQIKAAKNEFVEFNKSINFSNSLLLNQRATQAATSVENVGQNNISKLSNAIANNSFEGVENLVGKELQQVIQLQRNLLSRGSGALERFTFQNRTKDLDTLLASLTAELGRNVKGNVGQLTRSRLAAFSPSEGARELFETTGDAGKVLEEIIQSLGSVIGDTLTPNLENFSRITDVLNQRTEALANEQLEYFSALQNIGTEQIRTGQILADIENRDRDFGRERSILRQQLTATTGIQNTSQTNLRQVLQNLDGSDPRSNQIRQAISAFANANLEIARSEAQRQRQDSIREFSNFSKAFQNVLIAAGQDPREQSTVNRTARGFADLAVETARSQAGAELLDVEEQQRLLNETRDVLKSQTQNLGLFNNSVVKFGQTVNQLNTVADKLANTNLTMEVNGSVVTPNNIVQATAEAVRGIVREEINRNYGFDQNGNPVPRLGR